MQGSSALICTCLVILSLAHSVLGEREILRPLFSSTWSKPGPRWAMERILRFAWHLTSIAWLALAAATAGFSLPHIFAGFGLCCAVLIVALLRGHLAWPLFALIGFAGLRQAGWLHPTILSGGVLLAATIAAGAAGWHFYWAAGGRRGAQAAIPERDGRPLFEPPAWLTAAVGMSLLVFVALIAWVWSGAAPTWARTLLIVALVVFTARAVGDGKQVGFTKSDRRSAFAQWDDRLFTPLVVLLAFGTSAALLV